jgi:ligand-binding SRPBCC domain-containing protein
MPKLMKQITVNAPLEKVFAYIDKPANLPQIWPSLFEVKDVTPLPNGGHKFVWLYNMAGLPYKGFAETYEYIDGKRIVDRTTGDFESVFTWNLKGENGTTEVIFEHEYPVPPAFAKEESFFLKRSEYEAGTLLDNLKAKLEV